MVEKAGVRGPLVLVKGAGDFATGIIHRLHRSGFRVVATELERPLAVRRWVALSEAVYEKEYTVEGVTAHLTDAVDMHRVLSEGKVTLLVDPDARVLKDHDFDVVVDARSAKRNLGTRIDDAPVVVAIGPGFMAGADCHAVVETLTGKDLGKVILEGQAAPNTGQPYPLDGATPPGSSPEFLRSLVTWSPCEGTLKMVKDIGSKVDEGEVLARVEAPDGNSMEVKAGAKGLVRGMVRDGTEVREGMKVAEVDPTMVMDHLCTISEKARAIAGGVLEACMYLLTRKEMAWKL
jgi:xanthine dehydrogenase accessory factor